MYTGFDVEDALLSSSHKPRLSNRNVKFGVCLHHATWDSSLLLRNWLRWHRCASVVGREDQSACERFIHIYRWFSPFIIPWGGYHGSDWWVSRRLAFFSSSRLLTPLHIIENYTGFVPGFVIGPDVQCIGIRKEPTQPQQFIFWHMWTPWVGRYLHVLYSMNVLPVEYRVYLPATCY